MVKQRKKTQGKRDTIRASRVELQAPPVPQDKGESLHTRYSSSFVKCSTRQYPAQTDPDQMQDVSVTNSLVYAFYFNPKDINLIDSLPVLIDLTPVDSIRALGELLNVTDYEFNYSSFWNIDTLAGILREAQHQGLSDMCQRRIIEWFAFVIKKISIEGCTHDELFKVLGEIFLKAGRIITEGSDIPSVYNLIPKEIKIIVTHEDGDNKSEEMHMISLSSKKSSEGSREPDIVNTLKLPSEETFFRRKRKQSLSVPTIPVKKLRSSSELRVLRKLTGGSSRRRRRSTSTPAYVKVHTTESDQVYKDQETSKRFSELIFIVKKIYDVFGDEFKYSVIKMGCHDPAFITPVDICHSFKVPKVLKPLSSTPEQAQLSKAKVTSPKDKKRKGAKSEKEKKGKKRKSKTTLSGEDNEVTDEKETGANNKRKKEKKKKGSRVGKRPTMSEENTDIENGGKDKKSAFLATGISKLQAAISEVKLSPEQLIEIEKQNTKDMYILPLLDAVDSSFFENIFYLNPTGKQKAAEENKMGRKSKEDKKQKHKKGKNKHNKSKTGKTKIK